MQQRIDPEPWEKTLCSTNDHPKRVALAADIPQRFLNCCSFCHKANDLSTWALPIMNHFPSLPWQLSTPCKEQISTSVPDIAGQVDAIDLKRWCSLTLIAPYQADYTIYIDGSASGGTRNGGAATVVTRGSPVQPEVVTTIKTKGTTLSSSYEEEAPAMESALTWTSTTANHPSITILFCTDKKSLFEALMSSNSRASSIHTSINSIFSSIFIQWITGHSDFPGNELADIATKEATTIFTNTILPVSFWSSIQVIIDMICDKPTNTRTCRANILTPKDFLRFQTSQEPKRQRTTW